MCGFYLRCELGLANRSGRCVTIDKNLIVVLHAKILKKYFVRLSCCGENLSHLRKTEDLCAVVPLSEDGSSEDGLLEDGLSEDGSSAKAAQPVLIHQNREFVP